MKRSNRLILLIGVFLAALAFVIVIVLLSAGGGSTGQPNASAPPAKIATVLAKRDIALGVTITADMVTTKELAPEARAPGAFSEASLVIGAVARASITNGQQITSAAFAEASGANLEVPAGFTGIAVQVDQLSGVGTLIKTGDYVDIVAAVGTSDPRFPILDPATVTIVPSENYDHTTVKVLLQGIQVITTLLPPPPTTETGTATPAPGSGVALNGQQEIVILAVTPQQAEVIKFAQLDGIITLTLRSPKDFVDADGNPIIPETVVTTGVILKTMVEVYGVVPPKVILDAQPTAAP